MIKIISLTISGIMAVVVFANSTEHRLVDGEIQFVIAEVNRGKAHSQDEKQKLEDKFNAQQSSGVPLDVVNYTPTSNEVNLSTCLIKIEGAWHFSNYKNNKSALEPKLSEVKQQRDMQIDGSDKHNDYSDRYSWLLSYYNSLP